MEHLSNLRFVHRDLATRNILLTSDLRLKVAALGLSRDVYAPEYKMLGNKLVPLRWLSPEAFLDNEYSTKSDSWAYGIFCWEIFTLGDFPYPQLSDNDVIESLKVFDMNLDSPLGCPKEIHDIIERCMAENPGTRPSFSEIAVLLTELNYGSDC